MKSIINAMTAHFENVPDRLRKAKWLVWLFFVVATAFFITGMGRTTFDMTVEGWFADDDPTIVAFDWFHDEFGSEDHLYIVYKAKDGDVFSQQSLKAVQGIRQDLLARMSGSKKVNSEKADSKALQHITKITTLINAPVLMAEGDSLVSRFLVGKNVPSNQQALDDIHALANSEKQFPLLYFSKDKKYGGIFVETDFGAISIDSDLTVSDIPMDELDMDEMDVMDAAEVAQERPRFKPTDISDYIALMNEVKSVLEKPQYAGQLEYFPVGNTATMEYNLKMIEEMGMLNLLALLVIAVLLWFLFRSLCAVIWPITIVILTVIWSVGLFGWLGLPITSFIMITVMLILTVGIANSVHLMSGYIDARNQGNDHRQSMQLSFKKSAVACLLTAITTMVAMLALSTTAMIPIQIFGFMSAVGVGIAFLFAVYLLPLMLDLWAPKGRTKAQNKGVGAAIGGVIPNLSVVIGNGLTKVLPLVQKAPRGITIGFIAFFALCLYGASHTRVDTNPTGQFPKDSKVRKSFEVVDDHMMGTQSMEIYLDLAEENAFHDPLVLNTLDQLQKTIEQKYSHLVVRTSSLVDIVKSSYKTLHQGREDMYIIPETKQVVSQTLFMFNSANPDVRKQQVSENYDRARIGVRLYNTGSDEYTQVFEAMRIDIDEALDKLKVHYPEAKISITGMLALMMQGADYLTRAQLQSFMLAFVFVTILLLLYFGSLKAGMISIIPNLIPAMLAFGILGWFDIALDFSTMMIAPVIIGIAVDDTVHFITRYRAEVLHDGDITRALQTTITQTGQAIVYTTLVLGLGFGMLAFSSAAGTANVGILGASAIFAGLLNDLFFLPAMILLFKLKFEKSTTPANVVIEPIAKEQI